MTRPSAAATAAEAPYAGATGGRLSYWDADSATMSEAVFQGHVVREAEALGYRVYHTKDSRGSAKGFPDLVLVRPAGWGVTANHAAGTVRAGRVAGRIVYLELKAEHRGKLTPEQRAWREVLVSAGAECYAPVRPRDFERIVAVLAATGRPE